MKKRTNKYEYLFVHARIAVKQPCKLYLVKHLHYWKINNINMYYFRETWTFTRYGVISTSGRLFLVLRYSRSSSGWPAVQWTFLQARLVGRFSVTSHNWLWQRNQYKMPWLNSLKGENHICFKCQQFHSNPLTVFEMSCHLFNDFEYVTNVWRNACIHVFSKLYRTS